MKTKFVIIGGGVAGLAAALRLTELGEEPCVVEGGAYPSHKICGEFLSPECLMDLESWGIKSIPIPGISINTGKRELTFPFPSVAGGLSHLALDPGLAERAKNNGASIRTNTQVKAFIPKKNVHHPHLIYLSNGETLEASTVIMATGRIPSHACKAPLMKYRGFKSHFAFPTKDHSLAMYSLPGAYIGISPIEDNKFNVACLADLQVVGEQDPQAFMEDLCTKNPALKSVMTSGKNLFANWMTSTVPNFGIRKTPDWRDVYFIGDAAVSIPPACGNGLAMAIAGGKLAGEFASKNRALEFKMEWSKRCSSQVFWAKQLHKLMLNPNLANKVIVVNHLCPYIGRKLYDLTRTNNK